jgi:hypothetical protein
MLFVLRRPNGLAMSRKRRGPSTFVTRNQGAPLVGSIAVLARIGLVFFSRRHLILDAVWHRNSIGSI